MFTAPPVIITGPEPFTVIEGEDVIITCTYTGTPKPTHTWHTANKLIKPGKKYRVEVTNDTITLTLPQAKVTDTGEFNLTLENPAGKDSYTVFVTIVGK